MPSCRRGFQAALAATASTVSTTDPRGWPNGSTGNPPALVHTLTGITPHHAHIGDHVKGESS
jgi:hypothetical protein